MTMITIPSVAYEISGDMIRIEQDYGAGEVDRVDLHRMHLEHIAGKLGIPVLTGTAAEMARRLQSLYERLNDVAAAEYYRTEIVERCGSGISFLAELDGVVAIAYEFLQDIRVPTDQATPCNENPPAISVATDVHKCGCPANGEAMRNAEGQAKQREMGNQEQRSLDLPGD